MWQLSKDEAVYSGGGFSLSVPPADPVAGANLTLGSDTPIARPLWSWAPVGHQPPTLSEAHTRGADLVLQYGPCEDFPFHTEVYWRCEPAGNADEASIISLVLSIRTHKLESHPVYEVQSLLHSPHQTELTGGESVARLVTASDEAWSLIETVQPGDQNHASPPTASVEAGGVRTAWRLFDLFMEKGVIRRARLSLALAPGAMATDEAFDVARRLCAAAAPLST